jgi:hypothetical protein
LRTVTFSTQLHVSGVDTFAMPRTCVSLVLPFALLASLVTPSCGGFSAEVEAEQTPTAPAGPKAPVVKGTPETSELTEAFGLFVAPSGKADNDGSLARPFDTVSAAIAAAQKVGKRVYVCSGTYREQLTLVDSISVIGGLDCGKPALWKTGAKQSRLEAPASPAVRAKDITTSTRLEGFEIVAPDATGPSGSSIGVLADHAAALVIANAKVTAGDATDGADGKEGIQLAQTGNIDGEAAAPAAECEAPNSTCYTLFRYPYGYAVPRPKGGESRCNGANGMDGTAGGQGGNGPYIGESIRGRPNILFWSPMYAIEPGGVPGCYPGGVGDAAVGFAGASGGGASGAGLVANGYVPSNGNPGLHGSPGHGGAGGWSDIPTTRPVSTNVPWSGESGAGGGAGGCPGLAGTAGGGGGASVAVALIDSPIVIENTQLVTGRGGNAGGGTFGSDPTAGGQPGANPSGTTVRNGHAGGNGGPSGISTNGGAGPSVGVMHAGAAPTVKGGAIHVGRGGNGFEARSHRDALGNEKTIPATPPGVAQEILAL